MILAHEREDLHKAVRQQPSHPLVQDLQKSVTKTEAIVTARLNVSAGLLCSKSTGNSHAYST